MSVTGSEVLTLRQASVLAKAMSVNNSFEPTFCCFYMANGLPAPNIFSQHGITCSGSGSQVTCTFPTAGEYEVMVSSASTATPNVDGYDIAAEIINNSSILMSAAQDETKRFLAAGTGSILVNIQRVA